MSLAAKVDTLQQELAARDESLRLHKEMVNNLQDTNRKLRT